MPAITLTTAEQAGVAAADTSLDTAFASGMLNPDTSVNAPALTGYNLAASAGIPPTDQRPAVRSLFHSVWVALVRALASFMAASTAVSSFLNAWSNGGGCAYYRDLQGIVRLEGFITSGALSTAAFQLPVGFRPLVTKTFPTSSNGAFGSVQVDTSGNVTPLTGSTTAVSLDSISFRTT